MEIVWNLHKFGKYPRYGTTINLFFSKLCRKNPTRNVVAWYEMVYFEFWVDMVFALEGNSGENGQNWPFLFDTPTPRRRSPRLGVELCLGGGSFT